MNLLTPILLMTFLAGCAGPQHVSHVHHHPEKYYQDRWCEKNHGVTEYVLADRTRVDCLTNKHAIEFDFAPKWAESIGQALYYAEVTGKRAGVVLILENSGDDRFKKRLDRVADRYGITVWMTTPAD